MGTAIGLDFGTTNSVVSYTDPKGKLKTFKVNGSAAIPSVIYFNSKEDYVIGTKAINLCKNRPTAGISSFKTKLNEGDETIILHLDGGVEFKIRPKAAVKYFLNSLIGMVKEYLIKRFGVEDGMIDRAVITVPAKFKDTAINAIKSAAASAMQLKVGQIKLVYEPTAAAVADLQEEDSDASRLLIYDFGGGTFDVSVIKKENGIFKQIITDGDPVCGGDNLTNILAQYLLNCANDEYDMELPWDPDDFEEDLHEITREKYDRNILMVKRDAEEIKKELSESMEATASFPFYTKEKSEDYIGEISRKDFEKEIRKKINHTVDITKKVVESEETKAIGGIDKIILAGGSSQIPLIREVLQDKLGRFEINSSENVETLISRGAAILARDIEKIEKVTSQKTTVQLGVASTAGMQYGSFETIIDIGRELPCKGYHDFKLMNDDQQSLKIAYYERDISNYPRARQIGDDGINQVDILTIDLPQGLKKSDTIVRVQFNVDKDASLELSAKVIGGDGQTVSEETMKISRDSDLI